MKELLETILPPAVIIGVIIYTNQLLANGINKRIDDLGKTVNNRIGDLRAQMGRDHDKLANHLIRVESKFDSHVTNYSIHKTYEDFGFSRQAQQPYIESPEKWEKYHDNNA